MEKESYSIDDILSEVKRRRESENREQANTEAQVSAQTYKQAEPEKNIEAEPELKDDIKVQQPEVKVSVAEDKPTKTEVFIEKEENTAKSDTADIVIPTIEEEKNAFTDTDEVEENESVASINQSQAEPQENNGMVDLFSLAGGEVILPQKAEEPKKEEYVNISNPEDNEIYDAPKKPSTPQEQMQMAIDSIEKRSKYLDEPNVISDEAVDNIVNSISFFDDEDDKNLSLIHI